MIGASDPLKAPEFVLIGKEGYLLASLNCRVRLSDWPVVDIVSEVDRRTATVALINDNGVVNALQKRTVHDPQHRVENRALVLGQRSREVGHGSIIAHPCRVCVRT